MCLCPCYYVEINVFQLWQKSTGMMKNMKFQNKTFQHILLKKGEQMLRPLPIVYVLYICENVDNYGCPLSYMPISCFDTGLSYSWQVVSMIARSIDIKGMEHVPNIFMSFDKYLFLEVINILI